MYQKTLFRGSLNSNVSLLTCKLYTFKKYVIQQESKNGNERKAQDVFFAFLELLPYFG